MDIFSCSHRGFSHSVDTVITFTGFSGSVDTLSSPATHMPSCWDFSFGTSVCWTLQDQRAMVHMNSISVYSVP